ncbi:hypothetical protein [Streptomyces parvulus]|uniref:hypothetical protein n=1 Tax=Streptomyces parvulus TaxID=146923 RepID=UPI0038240121
MSATTLHGAPVSDPPPWGTRIQRASDGRFGTLTAYDAALRATITWDGAIIPERHTYSQEDLAGPDFEVFTAVTHCSDCGEVVDPSSEDDVEDGYTTCCNEGACGPCAAVNGVYACGTEATPTG